jgi:hypothetical protein
MIRNVSVKILQNIEMREVGQISYHNKAERRRGLSIQSGKQIPAADRMQDGYARNSSGFAFTSSYALELRQHR